MNIAVHRGDLTALEVDAVVNAANSGLLGGGGVDGAIHRRGGPAILAECRHLRATRWPDGLPAGSATTTTAGDLPARWVIHTVGPTWARTIDKSATLESCYRESLREARRIGARTVAFPTVSAGIYRWPMPDATRIAVRTVAGMAAEVGDVVERVVLVAFSDAAEAGYRAALAELDELPGGDAPQEER